MGLLTVTISGFDVTAYVNVPTLRITNGMAARADTSTLHLSIPTKNTGKVFPLAGSVLRVSYNSNDEFSGVIQSVSSILKTPTLYDVTVTAADFSVLLNTHPVVKGKYPSQSAGERMREILSEFAPAFAANTSYIEDGPTIGESSYNYQTISSVLDGIAQAVGYFWYVDTGGAIHFFDQSTFESPLSADYGNTLDADGNEVLGGVSITEDVAGLHNVVIVKDYGVRSSRKWTDHYKSDGAQSFYRLGMLPFSLDDVDVQIRPPGAADWQTMFTQVDPLQTEQGGVAGPDNTGYICFVNQGFRFPEDKVPPLGTDIKVQYNPVMPQQIRVAMDRDSIAEMKRREAGYNNGEHRAVVSVPDIIAYDTAPVDLYAHRILSQQAWPVYSGSFTTWRITGWKAWQYFDLLSASRKVWDWKAYVQSGYTNPQPIRMVVTSVTTKFTPGDTGSGPGLVMTQNVKFKSLSSM